jgi:acyl dehydratase
MAEAATTTTAQPLSIEDFKSRVATRVGVSAWHRLSQSAINTFADITSDVQYIHVDDVRAKDGPFGGTIAHGMLSLSMISAMFYEAVPAVEGVATSVNYGFDKVRFLSPVPSGSEINGSFTLKVVEERGKGQYLFRFTFTMQAKGATRPAVHADWLVMQVLA